MDPPDEKTHTTTVSDIAIPLGQTVVLGCIGKQRTAVASCYAVHK